MDFELPEELKLIRDTVGRFVKEELMPLERTVIERDANRGMTGTEPLIPPADNQRLLAKARDLGLWGIDVPPEYGGLGLGALAKCVVVEELNRTIVPFILPPETPNLHLLMACCTPAQRERYLLPYARGEVHSSLCLTEPAAGSDVQSIEMKAVRKGDRWVLNGTKMFITRADEAGFFIVIAVNDKAKRAHGGLTAFLVDRDAPGLKLARPIPMIGAHRPWEMVFEDVELTDDHVLGEVGGAFIPLQNRLGVRRLEIGTRCVGQASRALEMMIEQARLRVTFGQPLAERQAVQWWIADSAVDIHATRLMAYQAAWRADQGETDLRFESSMIKIFATEMVGRVIDRAMQAYGGYGMTKDMPLEFLYRGVRMHRIYEGPTEIHRWQVAKHLLRGRTI
ncbi:MAG: acyl-CoA dehydrogenase [Betaproteobacteria bacterium]|nr:acyl-CoA dehydrogenase [Betaproteobacteria bacterium]